MKKFIYAIVLCLVVTFFVSTFTYLPPREYGQIQSNFLVKEASIEIHANLF